MRPSRFLVVVFVLLSLLAPLASLSSAQTVTIVYSFTGQASSAYPYMASGAVQGRDGMLYGTTQGQAGTYGSIFAVSTSGLSRQLHQFNNTDGATPLAGLTLATDGAFYGTTTVGGSAGNGVLFRVTPTGNYTALHNFAGGSDGLNPYAPPIEALDGNLYGTTLGSNAVGPTIYKYSPSAGYSSIYQFDLSQAQGIGSGLVQAADGNLYGAAVFGGSSNCGAAFKISLSGQLLSIRSFPCGAGEPNGPLPQASDGNFYGTTVVGGSRDQGTIFKIDRSGTVSILRSFLGYPFDAENPASGLVEGTDGKLYGTSPSGGTAGQGALYQITTSGMYELLYSFTQPLSQPYAMLFQDTNGLLYGEQGVGGANNFGAIYSLDMGLGSFITFVLPGGKVGQTAQVLGQGLTGATSVTFNGVPATSFKVATDTYMTAVVPSGATTGKVVVSTPSGALTSNVSFKVIN